MANTRSRFLAIAGVCAVLAPILMLGSDLLRFAGHSFEWTIGLFLAFVLFVPAIIGFAYLLAAAGSRLAYVGGALAFFGAMAGASMQTLFRVYAVLEEQGSHQTAEQLASTMKLVASTQMIGITWPIGLITLAVGTLLVDRRRWLMSLLLAIGAIAFPIGRIAGSQTAVVVSGIFLIGAFGLIGKQLLSSGDFLE